MSMRRVLVWVALFAGCVHVAPVAAEPVAVTVDRAEVERVHAEVSGRTLIVDWHGTWDYTTIQAALDATTNGDTVIVLPSAGSPDGAYVENIVFPPRAVTLRSIDPENPAIVAATVVDGGGDASCVAFKHTPAGARLEGMTLKDGKPGVYLDDSSPTIARNIVRDCGDVNYAVAVGAAIHVTDCSPTIRSNEIYDNYCHTAGGALYLDNSNALVAENRISRNQAWKGGAIAIVDGSPTITRNEVWGNLAGWGGGIHSEGGSPVIGNNMVSGNHSTWEGGGIYCSGSAVVVNNVIAGNTAGSGSVVHTVGPTAIVNNTIVANDGYVARGPGATGQSIVNNVVAFNSGGLLGFASEASVRHNCVFGNGNFDYMNMPDPTGVDGNISVDPMLADRAYGNVHIQPDSPCKDAGDGAGAIPGFLDLDGQSRAMGEQVDIGADESDGTLWAAGPQRIVRVAPNGDDGNDGSTWALAKRTVQDALDNVAAAQGGEVWVASGIYFERIHLWPFARLYGGFAGTETALDQRDWVNNVTVLDGQQEGSVVTALGGYRVGRISGFTITHGAGYLGGDWRRGGGIRCTSSMEICNNFITANSANVGGGIHIEDSAPLIHNNVIAGNRAEEYGGAVNCDSAVPVMVNNTLVGNSAVRGGALYYSYPNPIYPTLVNSIVAYNSSGVYGSVSCGVFRSNCFFGNAEYDFYGGAGPMGTDGYIGDDPLFLEAPDAGTDGVWATADDVPGDLRLREESPCVDAGTNGYVVGVVDVDGDVRVVDGDADGMAVVDMGAYELFGDCQGAFDADHNCTVDLEDFADFVACLGGPGESGSAVCLSVHDADGNGSVDVGDFARLQVLFEGASGGGTRGSVE